MDSHGGSISLSRNIAKIDARKCGDRCIGLWIEHSDGNVEILGQWDPSNSFEILGTYQTSQGALRRLTFHFEEVFPTRSASPQIHDRRTEFCREVRVVVGEGPLTPIEDPEQDAFVVEDMGTVSFNSALLFNCLSN